MTGAVCRGSMLLGTACQRCGRCDAERTRLVSLERERDEADRRAGAAERQMVSLKDDAARRAEWLDKAKRAAGYDTAVSFDEVWAQALPALLAKRNPPQPPAIGGMPCLDNGLNSVIEGALEIVRKRDPGMRGLIHNLERLQEWIDLYLATAWSTEEDTSRLDWLDQVTARTNERNGSRYGWRYEINHNRAALTDCNAPARTIREAIDYARFGSSPHGRR